LSTFHEPSLNNWISWNKEQPR